MLYPATPEVLGVQESFTLWFVVTAPPVPLSACVAEVAALLANVAETDDVPLACGLKVTVYEALCPAAKVNGRVIPLSVNSGLLMLADETVTLVPLAVNEAVRLLLLPTLTLPKPRLAGETAS